MRVLICGANGMVGQAVLRRAKVLKPDWQLDAPTRQQLDLLDGAAVRSWLKTHKYDLIVVAAAKVGGIKANMDDQVGFMTQNMMIGMNIVTAAHEAGVEKMIYLGSSCMYPRDFGQVLKEEHIFAGPFEPTNEGYAIAKTATGKLCEFMSKQYGRAYRTLIPCNLFGPADRYDAQNGHLVAAIIQKIHNAAAAKAPTVEIWGHGEAMREFLYVDDLADAVIHFGTDPARYPHYLNIGSGVDHTINDYYAVAAKVIGFKGSFTHDLTKPVGMMKKLMDVSLAKSHGWEAKTGLEDGLRLAHAWYAANIPAVAA